MIICSQPECQTTAGCTCTNRLFDYNRLRGEVAAKNAEISALKKQVEELTAERDDARRYAVEARLRENQAEDRRVSESFARAKAEAAALEKPVAWPRGTRIRVEHDGFEGVVLDPYITLEGKRGQVCQLAGARVVHVYGEKWLQHVDEAPPAPHPHP